MKLLIDSNNHLVLYLFFYFHHHIIFFSDNSHHLEDIRMNPDILDILERKMYEMTPRELGNWGR